MRYLALSLFLLAAVFTTGPVWAGGSGLNVIVVVNQKSTNSLQLGNDYCEARGVPPQNVFRMTGWTGGAVSWSRTDFETWLLNPLLAMVGGGGRTTDYGLRTTDYGPRTEDQGPGTKDRGPRTRDQGPRSADH